MSGAKFFSHFDFVSGYYQIQVVLEDKGENCLCYTLWNLSVPQNAFQDYNASNNFQRVVDKLRQVLKTEDILSYLVYFICFH